MKKCFTLILFFLLIPILSNATLEIEKRKNKLKYVDDVQDKMYIYYDLSKLTNNYSFEQSMCYVDSSIQLAAELQNHDFEVTLKLYQGDLLLAQKDFLQAYIRYQESLTAAIISKNQENQLLSLSKLATFNFKIREYNNSNHFCEQALKIIGDEKSTVTADLHLILGRNAKALNKSQLALKHFNKSYHLYDINDDFFHSSKALTYIAKTYLDIEDYDTAIKISDKAIKLSKTIDDQWHVSLCYNDIAWAYSNKGDFVKCLKYNNLALDIRRSINKYYAVQSSLINIAILYRDFNNPNKAIELLHKALETKSVDHIGQINKNKRKSYLILSELYYENHDFELAYKYLSLFTTMDILIRSEYNLNEINEMDTKFRIDNIEYNQTVIKKAQRQKQLIILFFILTLSLTIIYSIYSKYNSKQKQNISLQKEVIERKKIEKELISSKNSLKLLNQIIRHDVTNDLAVIKSALNLFKNNTSMTMLDEIGRRVIKIIDQIRYYKTYESFIDDNSDLVTMEVSELIGDLIIEFPNIDVSLKGSGEVIADSALYSVFSNMLHNSINHGMATQVDIIVSPKDRNYRIDFCDNGVGIPEKIREKVFKEGFIYGKTGHTGIGLHIVKQSIERYGG